VGDPIIMPSVSIIFSIPKLIEKKEMGRGMIILGHNIQPLIPCGVLPKAHGILFCSDDEYYK